MKIVFMGTPKIAADILDAIVKAGYTPGLIVTQPDREKNRGKKVLPSEVKILATELGIPVLQPEKIKSNESFVEALREYEPDITIVAAYGRILSKEVLDIPKHGSINVHASLLPKYRGASPIQQAILEGDEITGVTIMKMDEGLDTGDMLLKGELPIGNMNSEELSGELGRLGGELLVKALPGIFDGTISSEKQDDALATFTGIIKKDDGRISFKDYTGSEIERMVRAYYPWPGVSVPFENERMKLVRVSVPNDFDDSYEAGEVIGADNDGITVMTKAGAITIEELQLPGKNAVSASAFLRGHKINRKSFVE